MTDTEAAEITDLQSGTDYLAQLSLANPVVAERQLMCFLDALLLSPPEPGILLALLEQARAPLCFVEEEMARRYHNKALPLASDEESYFQQVVSAWRKVGKAYALCARLEEPEAENAQYVALMATILHRCLYYTGMIILEHYRTRRGDQLFSPLGIHAGQFGQFIDRQIGEIVARLDTASRQLSGQGLVHPFKAQHILGDILDLLFGAAACCFGSIPCFSYYIFTLRRCIY